jgi:ABC-type polysaccharide/polyol phosphate transport system ATPase subunit
MIYSEDERILEVQGVCKRFSKTVPAKRRQLVRQFSRAILGRADDELRLAKDEFWALRDVSFSLQRGEALGLIGLNGAGKSTLLDIIARQILPDRGGVRSRGQIAAMINLTAGFESSLTGRENVFLKGALLSRSRAQIRACFDDIVSFAQIGDFLESPVGTYSSGMRMRLAFSVAIHAEPDLLLIDEVLSVGDFQFRQKCLRRLNDLRKNASFVFVSHSFQDVARFCSRVIVLDRGRLVFDGPTREGIRFYIESKEAVGDNPADVDMTSWIHPGAPTTLMGDFMSCSESLDEVSFHWCADDGRPVDTISQGKGAIARLRFRVGGATGGLVVGLPIWNQDGIMVTSVNSDVAGLNIQAGSDGWVDLQVSFQSMDLNPGTYFPVLSIMKNSEFCYRQPVMPLKVATSYAMTWGYFTPEVQWEPQQQLQQFGSNEQ